jgi:hypothetical protein
MIPAWTPLRAEPGCKRVALVGFAASSLHLVPWQDTTVELWGLNQAYIHFERRPDRWFEIHQPASRPDISVPTYLEDLKDLECPIYMIDRDPAYPTSQAYPIDHVRAGVPPLYYRYFTSGVSYMVALAIALGMEQIALYGIDCATGTEYASQKACLEAWCSLALGRGIDVVIPPQSALFKSPFLYGYEAPRQFPRVLKASEQFLRDRITAYKVKSNETLQQLHQIEGAIDELNALLNFAESKGRGAQFPLAEAADG